MTFLEAELLIPKLILGQHTAKEQQLFNAFIETAPYEEVSKILDLYQHQLQNSDAPNASFDTEAITQKIEAHINIYEATNSNSSNIIKLFNKRRYWLSTAAILLLFIGGYYLTSYYAYTSNPIANNIKSNIVPGSNKAVLQLDNGKTVVLDAVKDDSLTNNNGVALTIHNAKLNYHLNNQNIAIATTNTLTTPVGGQYQVVLPDGTIVWLNAASSLQFPTVFSGKNREVNLTGEAYFEVAKNKTKPFIVHVNETNVEVLGTHFNIMAYSNEEAIKTTLLEGSVKLNQANASTMLLPGEQAKLQLNKFLVYDVDVEQETAWKNGYFSFDKADIKSIMRQVSRWYDVEVYYEGKVPTNRFKGEIKRSSQLLQVLKVLELSGVHFKITDKKITVTE